MKQILEKKEMKNTLNERKLGLMPKIGIIAMTMVLYTVPAFADIGNIGQNVGTWGVEQIGYFALLIIAGALLKFLAKKAWVPAGVFACIGAVIYFVIKNPDKLEGIGAALFNIATQ